jgi:hypothetical protein
MQPVLRVSFLLELPFDIGFPDNSTITLAEGNAPFAGWEDVELSPMPGLPPFTEKGVYPGTSVLIRRAFARSARPLEATEQVFGPLLRLGQTRRQRIGRWLRMLSSKSRWDGQNTVAVVQLTRLVAAPGDADNGWYSDQFDVALAKLNEFLVAVAAVSLDPAIGPVSRLDLPIGAVLLVSSVESHSPPEMSLFLLNYGAQGEANLLTAEHSSR